MNVNISTTYQLISFPSTIFHDLRHDVLKSHIFHVLHGKYTSQHVIGSLVSDDDFVDAPSPEGRS